MKHYRAKTAGNIRIYKPEFVKAEINCHNEHNLVKDDSFYSPPPSNDCLTSCNHRQLSCNYVNGWLSEQSIRNVQEKTNYESSEIKKMYVNLLNNEEILNEEIDNILVEDLICKNYKAEKLLAKWYEHAYLPLNEKIQNEMNSEHFLNFDREKRKMYKKYLDHRNKKGHVFLDIYDIKEYNPLFLNGKGPGPLKATVKKLQDPVIHQKDKKNQEDKLVIACETGEIISDKEIEFLHLPPLPLVPLGRHGTKCSTWLEMKLTDIQSDVRLRSQARLYGIRNDTSCDLLSEDNQTLDQPEIFDKKRNWIVRRKFPQKYDANVQLV